MKITRMLKAFLRFMRLGPEPTLSFHARFGYWLKISGDQKPRRFHVSNSEYGRLLYELDASERMVISNGNGVMLDGHTIEPDASLNDGEFVTV